ncbi:MAG TPA: hypothetical protein VJT54_12245 [Verrucomicrobiae bacterium]|nr:hypothetical protein [Verrucomicrobiae bacterium]
MKPSSSIACVRVPAGYLLIECLVYIAVFAVITGLGLMTFYQCWDNSKALRLTTDDVAAALRAGERWRADIRGATGKITVENTATGELLRIPCGTNELRYDFTAGKIHRQLASSGFAESVLTAVEASQMVEDRRGTVTAWRWELDLKPHRKVTHLPLQFTFEAATKTAP